MYSLSVVYKCIATTNSRVAFVSDSLVPSAGALANYSTAPEIPFPAYSYQTPSQNQMQIPIQSQNLTQSPSQNPTPNPNPIPIQLQAPNPVQLQIPTQSQLANPTPNPSPIQSQISISSPSPSPLQTQSPPQSQPSFPPLLQTQPQPGSQSLSQLQLQSKSKSKSQTHRHNLTELDFEPILSYRATRTMSLDYRDTAYSTRKKDTTVDSSLLLKTPAEKKNSSVYDVDSNGKLEPIACFSQPSANVLSVID